MEEEGGMHFCALISRPFGFGECLTYDYSSFTEADFDKNADHRLITDPVVPHGLQDQPLPDGPGCSRVGRRFFLMGGLQFSSGASKINLLGLSTALWSFDADASPPAPGLRTRPRPCPSGFSLTLRFCGSMELGRSWPVGVPYDDKLYIFGGLGCSASLEHRRSWIEIYDPLKDTFLQPREVPKYVAHMSPSCYFLWDNATTNQSLADGKEHRKKTLFMLYDSNHPRLLSYDVEENCWEEFDPNFPGSRVGNCRRNLILWGRDTLFIIDHAARWSIYDLSSKKETGEVQVQGLKLDGLVIHAFCQCSSEDGPLTFFIFMEGASDKETRIREYLPYASVRLVREGKNFIATVTSEGALNIGDHDHVEIFTDQGGD
ncbi:uncharacterized protein LOC116203323 [Punica granatum]|uniref:Uncharacterized protein LOC116203323 n=1 Tax=Punica granatum TaxID=22663 RepID=A0A6P8D8M8_PUNGR|nr:uncharacterized protein LOC116203323 [Punica granatum]